MKGPILIFVKLIYILFGLALIWKIEKGTGLTESSILYCFLLAAQAFPVGFLLLFLPDAMHRWNIPLDSVSRVTDYLTLALGYLQWFHLFPWLLRNVGKKEQHTN